MPLQRTPGIVIGRRALGESDRLVTFYTREFGKVRGVAKSARRPRSRFGSGLELFTQGQLLFFETERSGLVQVDHFDIVRPFVGVREDLERLGQGAWVVECLDRLSAERDPHAALYGLLVRTLRALETASRPARVAFCFAHRAVDLLGYRLRLDRCLGCGQSFTGPARLDFSAGGLLCAACASAGHDGITLSAPAVRGLRRLRTLSWEEAIAAPIPGPLEGEMASALEAQIVRLMGHPPRSARFLAQTRRLDAPGGPR
jgi:DNA repair protein RecO (recombination protein O)